MHVHMPLFGIGGQSVPANQVLSNVGHAIGAFEVGGHLPIEVLEGVLEASWEARAEKSCVSSTVLPMTFTRPKACQPSILRYESSVK
jgi:hypothetical protein